MLTLIPDISPSRLMRGKTGQDLQASEAFALKRKRILLRDAHTCQGCGICLNPAENTPARGLEVHHINANPRDNRAENLVSLCGLCHGIFHIGCFARRIGSGMHVIHCPELSQAELNLLSWAMALTLFKTQESQESSERLLANKAGHLRELLLLRENFPASYFQDAEALATFHEKIQKAQTISYLGTLLGMLRSRYPSCYARRGELLGGLRIFYDPKEPLIFCDRHGKTILADLAASSQWESGTDWSRTWAILGQSLLRP